MLKSKQSPLSYSNQRISKHTSSRVWPCRKILKGKHSSNNWQYLHATVVAANWQILFQNTICEVYRLPVIKHSLFCLSYPNNPQEPASCRISSPVFFYRETQAVIIRHMALFSPYQKRKQTNKTHQIQSALSWSSISQNPLDKSPCREAMFSLAIALIN